MGHQPQPNPVVADVDIGMVAGLFCQFPDSIDKSERGAKVLELKGSYQLARDNLSVRQGVQMAIDVFLRQCRHELCSRSPLVIFRSRAPIPESYSRNPARWIAPRMEDQLSKSREDGDAVISKVE